MTVRTSDHDVFGGAKLLTPAEMAERAGVSIDTLRYYEREQLLLNVARAENGHRRYSHDDVLWVEVLRCLRDTGMTIEQLRLYCELGKQGDRTIAERIRFLREHRDKVQAQMEISQRALDLIDHKLDGYGEQQPSKKVAK
jgi:MerR family transcriptional regulator, aldehyde-responsive regulator